LYKFRKISGIFLLSNYVAVACGVVHRSAFVYV